MGGKQGTSEISTHGLSLQTPFNFLPLFLQRMTLSFVPPCVVLSSLALFSRLSQPAFILSLACSIDQPFFSAFYILCHWTNYDFPSILFGVMCWVSFLFANIIWCSQRERKLCSSFYLEIEAPRSHLKLEASLTDEIREQINVHP